MKSLPNISIFYLSVGSGHQTAAEAVEQALRNKAPDLNIQVSDPFTDNIDNLSTILERLQAASIALTPTFYDMAWRQGTAGSLFGRITELDLMQDLLKKEFEKHKTDIVIATHVLPTAMAMAMKSNTNVDHVFGIATDFGLHSYWPLFDVNGYFVGHKELQNTFEYRGLASCNVHVTGIPIKNNPTQETDLGERSSQKLRILLVVGGIRSGGYVELSQSAIDIIETVQNIDPEKIALTIVTGNQKRLNRKLNNFKSKTTMDLTILGFVDGMQRLMLDHDIIISKPGGLIISEALACGMGMILFKPGPGQERANADFLARHGAALSGETQELISTAIEKCLNNPDMLANMKSRAKKIGNPNAASDIADIILQKIKTNAPTTVAP